MINSIIDFKDLLIQYCFLVWENNEGNSVPKFSRRT